MRWFSWNPAAHPLNLLPVGLGTQVQGKVKPDYDFSDSGEFVSDGEEGSRVLQWVVMERKMVMRPNLGQDKANSRG